MLRCVFGLVDPDVYFYSVRSARTHVIHHACTCIWVTFTDPPVKICGPLSTA